MRQRGVVSVVCAVLVHLLGGCPAEAQEASFPECEPVSAESIARVAEQLGLTAEQEAWLQAQLNEDQLRDPGDLDELPEAGSALRGSLEAAFCWDGSPGFAGSFAGAVRARASGPTREVRGGLDRADGAVVLRLRRTPSSDWQARGGLSVERRRWSLRAGHLRVREGFGLLLATPGAIARAGGVGRPARGGWGTSVSTEPLREGVAVARTGRWDLEVSGTRLDGEALGTLVLRRGSWSAVVAGQQDGRGAALLWRDEQPGGIWGAEAAWSGSGGACGGSGAVSSGPWRFGASLTGAWTGFVPLGEAEPEALPDLQVAWAAEGAWRPGPGRFVRLGWELERRVRRDGWPDGTGRLSVEFGERVVPGVSISGLWRGRVQAALGAAADMEERLVRLEGSLDRRGWRGLVRVEERRTPAGDARVWTLRWGRRARGSWEVRVVSASLAGSPPGVWTYARRAGGTYGWDRLAEGTWIGGWVRWESGAWALEGSADARSAGWDVGLALRATPGAGA